jgi:carboxylesterase
MATTGWADWAGEVERAYGELAARCDRVVVAGLSMGATLVARLAAHHPEIAGLIVVNGALAPVDPAARDGIAQVVEQGVPRIPGPGNDVADPSQTELAYEEVAPGCMLSLLDALEELQDELPLIRCPSLVITSEQDHVVPPGSSDHFAAHVGGPVERMTLVRSFHVATLDYERDDLEARAVAFARQVTRG